jgi:hypothetical protein
VLHPRRVWKFVGVLWESVKRRLSPSERMKLVAVYGVYMRLVCGVSCTRSRWEYIASACIIWSGFIPYLAEEFVRWKLSLCLACVGLSDGHSDQELLIIRNPFFMEVSGCKNIG